MSPYESIVGRTAVLTKSVELKDRKSKFAIYLPEGTEGTIHKVVLGERPAVYITFTPMPEVQVSCWIQRSNFRLKTAD